MGERETYAEGKEKSQRLKLDSKISMDNKIFASLPAKSFVPSSESFHDVRISEKG